MFVKEQGEEELLRVSGGCPVYRHAAPAGGQVTVSLFGPLIVALLAMTCKRHFPEVRK